MRRLMIATAVLALVVTGQGLPAQQPAASDETARLNAWFDRPWKPGETRETALVVIGESPLDHGAIRQSLMRAARVGA